MVTAAMPGSIDRTSSSPSPALRAARAATARLRSLDPRMWPRMASPSARAAASRKTSPPSRYLPWWPWPSASTRLARPAREIVFFSRCQASSEATARMAASAAAGAISKAVARSATAVPPWACRRASCICMRPWPPPPWLFDRAVRPRRRVIHSGRDYQHRASEPAQAKSVGMGSDPKNATYPRVPTERRSDPSHQNGFHVAFGVKRM